MELRVNDYVRTTEGYICKILEIHEEYDDEYLDWNDIHSASIRKSHIIKSSPNIIDLIEVGDYVNGRYVDKYQGKLGCFCELPNGKWEFIEISNEHYLISSIVTKEQFSSMEYKVGE